MTHPSGLEAATPGPNADPRWWLSAVAYGLGAVAKNGAATLEPRSRCALLHHGSGLADPPNTSTRVRSLHTQTEPPMQR
jgi:hypothetical protein